MKDIGRCLLGIVLMCLGVFMFLQKVNVNSVSFYYVGSVSSAPFIIVLFGVFLVWFVIKTEWYVICLLILDIIAFVVSIVMGTRFTVSNINTFNLVVMIGFICVGLGFLLKGVLGISKRDDGGDTL